MVERFTHRRTEWNGPLMEHLHPIIGRISLLSKISMCWWAGTTRPPQARYGITPDLSSWEFGYTGYSRYLDAVIVVSGNLIGVGYAGATQTSANGIDWTTATNANTRWLSDAPQSA